jgi:hypothetical protein
MKQFALLSLVIALLIVQTALAKTEFRNDVEAKTSIAPAWSLKLKIKQYIANFDTLSKHYLAVSPGYKVNDLLKIGAEFRHVWKKGEDRISLVPTLSFKAGEVKLANRHKFEHRIRSSNTWRYRTRLKASISTAIGGVKTTPFLSEEIKYDLTSGAFDANEFVIGCGFELKKNLGASIYLMAKHDIPANWGVTSILGTSFSVKL